MSSQAWLGASSAAADFSQMLVQAMWDYEHPLKCISGVSDGMIEAARRADVNSVYDFVDLDSSSQFRKEFMAGVDRATAKAIIAGINRYPSVQVTARCEATSGGYEVRVTVERDVDDPTVHAPYWPSPKEEMWWVVVAGHEDSLLMVKKMPFASEQQEVSLQVGREHKPERVLLLSDCYPGCDQEVPIQ
jgi:pre-mRNA-splicing helicase BRR2